MSTIRFFMFSFFSTVGTITTPTPHPHFGSAVHHARSGAVILTGVGGENTIGVK
jgi:hypothetical protein